jgi:hypothetical protein
MLRINNPSLASQPMLPKASDLKKPGVLRSLGEAGSSLLHSFEELFMHSILLLLLHLDLAAYWQALLLQPTQ